MSDKDFEMKVGDKNYGIDTGGCGGGLGCFFLVIALILAFNAGRILDMLDRLIDKL